MDTLTGEQAKLVRCILDDPRYIKPSGKVNINALAKEIGKTWTEVHYLVDQIGNKIGNDL